MLELGRGLAPELDQLDGRCDPLRRICAAQRGDAAQEVSGQRCRLAQELHAGICLEEAYGLAGDCGAHGVTAQYSPERVAARSPGMAWFTALTTDYDDNGEREKGRRGEGEKGRTGRHTHTP